MKISPHAAAIIDAGRRYLVPLGLRQKGRSRSWRDDRGWFVIGVEFQPGFGQGSYLNVGCCWLWNAKGHFSYDVGHREEPFTEFTSMPEWQTEADRLATRASELVIRYRAQFASVESVANHYEVVKPVGFWPKFNAGIASGYVGRSSHAARLFREAMEENTPGSPEWLQEAALRCDLLLARLPRAAEFRVEVHKEVQEARRLMKLPELTAALP